MKKEVSRSTSGKMKSDRYIMRGNLLVIQKMVQSFAASAPSTIFLPLEAPMRVAPASISALALS